MEEEMKNKRCRRGKTLILGCLKCKNFHRKDVRFFELVETNNILGNNLISLEFE